MKELAAIGITRPPSAEPRSLPKPPVGPCRDLEIARRILAGDDEAFDHFYDANAGRVYAVSLRLCGEPAKARRLTQETFVRAWEGMATYRGASRLSSWLHRIAVNVAMESGRRRARWWKRLVPEKEGLAVRDELAARPGTRMDLERAIAALPDRARESLVLRDVEGYTYEEIAEIMGVAVGTVKAQVHRARGLVKERLER